MYTSPNIQKKLRYKTETILVRVVYIFLRVIPISLASDIGGYLAKLIGRRLSRSDVARRNLHRAMPELNDENVESIVTDMWENLGRTFAEFPHIAKLDSEKIKDIAYLEGVENIYHASNSNNGTIYFTAHLANWEIGPRLFSDLSYPVSIVYRKGNNPGLGRIIQNLRKNYLVSAIPKGQAGSREIVQRLKKAERIGILVDQKMNDGIKSSFFGLEAMTAPAIARLALKYHCPVIPVRVIRLNNCKFKVVVSPPLEINYTDDSEMYVQDLVNNINLIVEGWIRETPGQWIWLHNRWPSM